MKRIKLPDSISKMRPAIGLVACFLTGLFLALAANAQICGPATIHYIVRDAKGHVVDASTLQPENFASEKGDYWKRVVDKVAFSPTGEEKDNADVQSIKYVGGNACVMKLDELTLSMNGKTMHLIFDLSLDSYNDRDHSYRVIDSLPFGEGTFKLDATSDNIIAASKWKQVSKKP